tara:strand:- start:649 stop:756 length:108 start_codon:yes stop_codon:yes gene_type:complete
MPGYGKKMKGKKSMKKTTKVNTKSKRKMAYSKIKR